jgi:hypothetical protein
VDSGWRNARAALGVFGVLVLLVAVPAAVSQALPGEAPVPAGERLAVGYGVSLRPPPGARHVVGASRPGGGEVELRAGDVSVRVTAVEVRGPARAFAAHARHKFSRDDRLRAATPERYSTDAGVSGERGALTPVDPDGRPGCYAIFVAEGAGVVVRITPVAGCAAVPPEVSSAVRSLTFDPAGVW